MSTESGPGGDIASRAVRFFARRLSKKGSNLRVALARAGGVAIGRGVWLSSGVRINLGFFEGHNGRVSLGAFDEIGYGVVLDAWGGSIEIGERVFLGPSVAIYGHGGVTIGEGSLISMHSRILSSNHDIPPMGVPIRSQADVRARTSIGRDVWLGAGVTVLAGVTIGDGCIVGAGAVVADDLPPGAVGTGVPTKIVRYRDGAATG